jgi:D-3-phosphoglycerate dehydrogenase
MSATSSPRVVLVTGTQLVPPPAIAFVQSRGYEVRHVRQDHLKPEELHVALEGAAGYLIGGYEQVLPEHFEKAGDLEVVAWVGTDYQGHVPGWKTAFERGIAFINAPGANARSVAEFTTLLMLTMARPFTTAILSPMVAETPQLPPGTDLATMALGVIGLGRVGGRVARAARFGFGMQVYYTGPRRNQAMEHSLDVAFLPKPELLSTVDIVSLHRPAAAPGEPAELGPAEFARMRQDAIVVNTAHTNLVDLSALLEAAQRRGIRAAFDAPGDGPEWHSLLGLGPQRFLAVTPMGFNTQDANERASTMTARAVCDVLDGGTSELVNNPDFRRR